MTNPSRTTTVALMGTGNIAEPYALSIRRHPELALVGVFDVDQTKATAFAEEHGLVAYPGIDELLAAGVDVVVNLTSAPHHYATTRQLLEAGQTVFSEKPLALTPEDARELIALSTRTGARLACAPSLWLGPSATAVAEVVRGGELGRVRLVTAEVNQGSIEAWHPAPVSFYTVGPVVDAGVYPLTFLTALLGPIRSVTAHATTLLPERVTLSGESFRPTVADCWLVTATFEDGTVLRLSCNYYVGGATIPRTVDLHGDAGSIRLRDQYAPAAGVDRATLNGPFIEWIAADDSVPMDFALGLADFAAAIIEDRPHRTGAEHAAHVVEVLDAVTAAAKSGRPHAVTSSFPSPIPGRQMDVAAPVEAV